MESKKKIEKKTYKFAELELVSKLMASCKNDKGLKSSATTLNAIRIVRKVADISKKFYEEQKEIFEKLGVKVKETEQGQIYDWSTEDEKFKAKVDSALQELNKTDHEFSEFNQMSESEFVIYTQGLDTDAVVFLYGYLVKAS
jgi:hypothetical protein